MKHFNYYVFILILTLGCASRTTIDNIGPHEFYDSDEQFYSARSIKIYPKEVNREIRGVCLIGGEGDELGDYCSNIELALKDKDGEVIAVTTTKTVGHFIFTAIKPGLYELVVTNPSFRKYSNKIFVRPGSEILIHLKTVN